MQNGNIKLAMQSIRSTKWRSLFTMLGIIVGVVSVLMVIGLGEGAKRDVRKQIKEYGSDLILVQPGHNSLQSGHDSLANSGLFSGLGSVGSLLDSDVEAVSNAQGVETVAPLSLVNGVISYNNQSYPNATVIATSHSLPTLLNHKIEFGEFFRSTDEGKKFVVIGEGVAESVFKENVPVGKSLEFRGESYIVKGVFKRFLNSPLAPGANYDNVVFMPYVTGKAINQGASQTFQIIAKPTDPKNVDQAQANIRANLLKAHGGQSDFSVLKQDETLALTSTTLNLVTRLIAAIAAISLFVGGIGVMNVMIVSVTERTHEIGVRKAIGATDSQILGQFLAEAMMLSAVGGTLGVLIAYTIELLMTLFSDFAPDITLPMALLAIVVSLFVGTIFGVAPAIKAARKDPISALRHE